MKKKILIIGPYVPGKSYGGPVKSILNMIESLSEYYEFYVITGDRDLNSEEPYQEVEIGTWNKIGKANVFYVQKGKEIMSIRYLLKQINYELVYTSSLFSNTSVIIQFLKWLNIIKKTVLVAPCGEFSSGALAIKASKKKVFLYIYKMLNIHKKVIYVSSSNNDKQDIIAVLGDKTNVVIAGNIVMDEFKSINIERKKQVGQLKIVTLSRISRIKNIDYSLRLLKILADNDTAFSEILFDIYGPLEDKEYWKECLSFNVCINDKVKINYMGSIEYSEVMNILSSYHIFLLPTKGENFGHVIHEAFLAGCPVIISDQTPWKMLKDKKVGYDISLDNEDAFIDAIKYYLYLNENDYKLASNTAGDYGIDRIKNQSSIREHLDMFNHEISKGN